MPHPFFLTVFVLLAVQRLIELRISRRHEVALRARGAREHPPSDVGLVVAVHTTWFAATLLEILLRKPPFVWSIALPAFGVLLFGQVLRYLAMLTLGERWCVRVLTLPGAPPVTRGIYRHLRHPNYVGVMLEILALPAMHGAWITAIASVVAMTLVIANRIRKEERALAEDNGYLESFATRPRFVPHRK